MNKKLIASILLCTTTSAFAECEKAVTYLAQATPAPCAGFLFSPAKEQAVRAEHEDYKLLTEQSANYKAQLQNNKEQFKKYDELIVAEEKAGLHWQAQYDIEHNRNVKLKDEQHTRDWIWFAGGIITSVAIGYALNRSK